MKSLFDILSGKTNTNAILLCGPTSTLTACSDGVTRFFNKYLHDLLKEEYGFANVVYYDASNSNGKYVLDDESAFYSFAYNRDAYIEKYHTTPDGSAADVCEAREPISFSFGHHRSPDTDVPETNEAAGQQIVYQERNMQPESFYSELVSFMTSDKVRSAVIITNISDVIQNSDDPGNRTFIRRIADQLNSTFEVADKASDNLLIFAAPDVHNAETLDMLLRHLTVSSLRDKFLICSKGSWTFDRERCFVFSEKPGEDEIKNILSRYIITGFNSKRLVPKGKSVAELAGELNYILCEGFEQMAFANKPVRPVSLMQLKTAIENYIDSYDGNAVPLTSDILPSLTPFTDIRVEQDPEKKLKTTKGWENVYKEVSERIEMLKKLYPTQISKHSDVFPSPLAIKRLMPCQSSYLSADQIHHIMLAGPPGVGKTTAAHLIGKIFHDNGILETGFVKAVKASDIISDHVGGTFALTDQAVSDAEGGVLFIDEAYMLYEDPKDTRGNFKKECLDTLTQALTDKSRHFLLILSGYSCTSPDSTDGVEALLRMNQGLNDRIPCRIIMKPYSPELLADITIGRLASHGYELGDTVNRAGLVKYWEREIRTSNRRTFSNARKAVRLCESLIREAAKRSDGSRIEDVDFPSDVRDMLLGQECSYEELLEEIERDYPGLGETVRIIAERAIANIRSMKARADRRTSNKNEPLKSLVFVGNPGAGKNTIVKLLARILGIVGIMSGCDPITVSDPRHCTPHEFTEKMQSACDFNTLFFVDEAYDLPRELVTSMLPQMTENPEFIAVFAVYPKEYEDFLKKNDGLSSRIVRYDIPDYKPQDLVKIFRAMCNAEGYTYSDELISDLGRLFRRRYDTRSTNDSYANARDVENLLREIAESCDERSLGLTDESERFRLETSDIPAKERKIIENTKRNNDIESILAELNTYVGFEPLRRLIIDLYDTMTADKDIFHIEADYKIGHFMFCGDPGTGKTTGANIFARALYAMGLLKSDHVTIISAADLIAGYVGQTADKARSILTSGKYGVILIDEAYMLDPEANSSNEDMFRREAVTQLLLFLEEENRSGDTVVILAGYKDKMEKLMKSSCGLRSRVGTRMDFPNYTDEECLAICRRFLAQNTPAFKLSCEAEPAVREAIQIMKNSDEFSNARNMRTISQKMISAAKKRLIDKYRAEGSADAITEKEKSEISYDDAATVTNLLNRISGKSA